MFKITGKQQFGGVWDKGTCLAVFNRGVATTNDPDAAEILKAKGYTVTGEAPVTDPLDKMTVEELKAYAAEKNIDLGDATKKAEIKAVIKAAEANSQQ